jgi:two-component system nitrate/nitrite sensor histidine kinase NarX
MAGRDLLTELDFGPTINKVIQNAEALLDADWASVCMRDPRSANVQQTVPDTKGHTCVQALHTGVEPTLQLLPSGQVVQRRGTCSACLLVAQVDWCASVAIADAGENLGTLCVMRSHEHGPFEREQLRTLQVFADWAAIAIANAHRLRAAQEVERADRQRIAAHLHDNAAQTLSAIGLKLDFVEARLDDSQRGETLAQLRSAKAQSQQLMRHIRAAFGELRQSSASADDLVSALADCVDDFRQACEIATEFTVAGRCALPVDKQVQVLQIVREALANVRHHAQAKSVRVKLAGDADAIRITVQDDGIGFDLHAIGADYHHLGTTLMRERAQRSGGFLTIHSYPGCGTEVTIHYPVS